MIYLRAECIELSLPRKECYHENEKDDVVCNNGICHAVNDALRDDRSGQLSLPGRRIGCMR
jgi:hypothetical protein